MKKLLLISSVVLFGTPFLFADTLAQWTFENSFLAANYSPGANTSTTNFFAEGGLQAGTAAATGHHSAGATVYSSPSGNGSLKSLSGNTWTTGDYWQVQLSTVGQHGITLAYDQTGSATGPRDFNLSYSLDGTSFTTVGSTYSVLLSSWSPSSVNSAFTLNYDLSGITALDNAATVFFRVTDVDTTSINGGTVATGGTDRIDNFTVLSVPEPSTVAMVCMVFAGLIAFRRKSK